jgi:hypothetical protein
VGLREVEADLETWWPGPEKKEPASRSGAVLPGDGRLAEHHRREERSSQTPATLALTREIHANGPPEKNGPAMAAPDTAQASQQLRQALAEHHRWEMRSLTRWGSFGYLLLAATAVMLVVAGMSAAS